MHIIILTSIFSTCVVIAIVCHTLGILYHFEFSDYMAIFQTRTNLPEYLEYNEPHCTYCREEGYGRLCEI
jgi:hypothetical protein